MTNGGFWTTTAVDVRSGSFAGRSMLHAQRNQSVPHEAAVSMKSSGRGETFRTNKKDCSSEEQSFLCKGNYLKSLGRLSTRLHFEHSAMFLSLPLSYIVFMMISPPQSGQRNFCVATAVREFLLAPAMVFLHFQINTYRRIYYRFCPA